MVILPHDVYCAVPACDLEEVAAFLAGVPADFTAVSEDAEDREPRAVLAALRRLAEAGDHPSLYWSRGADSEHYAHGYDVSLLSDGGLVFGVGVLDQDIDQARQWLERDVARRGLILVVVENPPPQSFAAFERRWARA